MNFIFRRIKQYQRYPIACNSNNLPRRYTTILADGFATMMWIGVSIIGTQLFISTNSLPGPTPRLQRIYRILYGMPAFNLVIIVTPASEIGLITMPVFTIKDQPFRNGINDMKLPLHTVFISFRRHPLVFQVL